MSITVGQLIDRLNEYPKDMKVVFEDGKGGDYFEIDNNYAHCVDDDTVEFKADGTIANGGDEVDSCEDAVIISGVTCFDTKEAKV